MDTLIPQSDGSVLYKSVGDYGTDHGTLHANNEYPVFSNLDGKWVGTIHGRGTDGSEYISTENYEFSGCSLGNECAKFNHSEFACSGSIILDKVWANLIEGHSVNTSGCSEGSGIEYYQWQSDGSLLHFSQGTWGVDLAILYRE